MAASDPYACTSEVKQVLLQHLRAVQPMGSTLTGISHVAELIEDIDRRERQERRQDALSSETKRLWALLAPEYNALSGHTSNAWLDDDDERLRALAALENRPNRLAQKGEFDL